MESIGIIEAGSTFTKGYIATGSRIASIGIVDIGFKKHYREAGTILESDIERLVLYVKELLTKVPIVRAFGTSVFREAAETEIDRVRSALDSLGDVTFEVVTAERESEYTAYGAVRGLSYPGPIAVMVGGGGSTEVSIWEGENSTEWANSPIGVGDVNHQFPDLPEDIASTDPEDVVKWISRRLLPIAGHADMLVLAGGDFPLLYENAGYNLQENPYSSDPEKSSMLLNSDKTDHDEIFFHELKLSAFRSLTPDTPAWWDGTRAMCCFVAAVAAQLGASILIPTRISMIYGINAEFSE